MAEVHPFEVHSGFVTLLDPAALRAFPREEPDRELLERASEDGALHFWPAPDEEPAIWLAVDEELPHGFARAVREERSARLHVPSGELWLTDPAFIFEVAHAGDEYGSGPVRVTPGDYEVTAAMLEWPLEAHEQHLLDSVGRLRVMTRDVLGIVAFLLASATIIGLPVFLIGRALDDGLAGAWDALRLGAVVLLPLWLIVVAAWRVPSLVAVDRADRAFLESHPDAAVTLKRIDGDGLGLMLRWMSFPFPDDRFPDELGAVVQRTVLDGVEPARLVIHDTDGDWAIGEGVNDPNEPGACIVTHIHHVLASDPSLETLGTMPAGFRAEREAAGDGWSIRPHEYEED